MNIHNYPHTLTSTANYILFFSFSFNLISKFDYTSRGNYTFKGIGPYTLYFFFFGIFINHKKHAFVNYILIQSPNY